MITASYEQLVQRISTSTGLEKSEIERRIDAKRAKLSDLISKEGAAQIVAAELGMSFDRQKVKINELLTGMRKITVIAKVLKISPIRTFKTKTSESKVVSLLVADDSATVRCVLWDTNHIRMVEEGKISEGSVIEIKDASVRGTDIKELHVGSLSDVKLSDEELENVVLNEPFVSKKIVDLKTNDRVKIRAAIAQMFDPKFFMVCPECGKKISLEGEKYTCQRHGIILPKERILLNMILDDGVSNMRAIGFTEILEKMFQENEENLKNNELFITKKQDMLGKELFFSGRVRLNKVFNTQEFLIQDIEEIDPDALINELSK